MWFNCTMPVEDDVEADRDLQEVSDFFRRLRALPKKRRHALMAELPVAPMQTAALRHPDPWVRRATMFFLDHYANDASTPTFLAALDDPCTPVREMALHGLACEQCRAAELCVDDVVPVLCRVVASDPSPDVRHKAIPILLRLSNRDARARVALESAASSDSDQFVQQAAVAALEGRFRDALRSRHDLVRRSKTRRAKASAAASLGHPDA
jgi:HEAT repeat protein